VAAPGRQVRAVALHPDPQASIKAGP
jgi:hypothetical protein